MDVFLFASQRLGSEADLRESNVRLWSLGQA